MGKSSFPADFLDMGLPYHHHVKLMAPSSHGWDGPVGIKHDLILKIMCLT